MSKKVIPVLLVVSLLLSACGAFTNIQSSSVQGGSGEKFQNKNELAGFPFEVPQGSQSFEFDFEIQVKQGSVVWRLKTPSGTQVLGGQLLAGEVFDEVHTFPPTPGEWVLEMEFRDASGEYAVQWGTQ